VLLRLISGGIHLPVAEDVVNKAREGDRASVESVITDCFPAVHRVAHALTGDPAVAGKVVRFVLRRSVDVMPRWRSGLIPENWFFHNTLMTLRRLNTPPPQPNQDLLITVGPTGLPAYAGFIRALRTLPVQQAEAFILHHGEHLNERLLGVAMDLSTGAAGAHLAAATASLQTLAGNDYPALVSALDKAYMALTPPETIVRTTAETEIRSVFWGKLLRRMVKRLITLAILAAIGFAAWYFREQLIKWFELARTWFESSKSATTQPS
jgi:DNA-directed RNA polymerase specialized sigma24 family protein